MHSKISATRRWPLWLRLAATAVALGAACAVQLPIERDVPGEPFLLFFLAVIGTSLAFGRVVGFFGVGLSTLLSVLFFEPAGTFALTHASDVIKIELYAIVAGACVAAMAYFADGLVATGERNQDLERLEARRSLLLQELTHGVANNFASVASLISLKSTAVRDPGAKLVLDEAIEQVGIMARVHRRLRADGAIVSLDSQAFIRELCNDLMETMRSRQVSIDCKADSCQLSMDRAVLLGLIINELVTNASKHAFPDGRPGSIHVDFHVLGDRLHLCVSDNGIGMSGADGAPEEGGKGQELLRGLADELQGQWAVESSPGGTTFRLSIPCAAPASSATLPRVTVH